MVLYRKIQIVQEKVPTLLEVLEERPELGDKILDLCFWYSHFWQSIKISSIEYQSSWLNICQASPNLTTLHLPYLWIPSLDLSLFVNLKSLGLGYTYSYYDTSGARCSITVPSSIGTLRIENRADPRDAYVRTKSENRNRYRDGIFGVITGFKSITTLALMNDCSDAIKLLSALGPTLVNLEMVICDQETTSVSEFRRAFEPRLKTLRRLSIDYNHYSNQMDPDQMDSILPLFESLNFLSVKGFQTTAILFRLGPSLEHLVLLPDDELKSVDLVKQLRLVTELTRLISLTITKYPTDEGALEDQETYFENLGRNGVKALIRK